MGVSVTVALNGGLFKTAQDAAEGTKVEGEKERILSIVLGALDNEGKVVFDDKLEDTLEDAGFTLNGNTITSEETGKTYLVSERGSVTEQTEPAIEYTLGDEVTVSGESFYVIGQEGETVTLLAKYNINTTSLKQANGDDITADRVKFSNNIYWSTETTYPLDLNEYKTCPAGGAIDIAKQYAEEITGSRDNGRLMTKGEAESLNTPEYQEILYGTEGAPLNFWLGSAEDQVMSVYGVYNEVIGGIYYGEDGTYGVRPVIKISKSAI